MPVNKLFVRERGTQIKVEVTPVLRGYVFEAEENAVSDAVEEQFGFAAIQVVSFPDLFAGSWWRRSIANIRATFRRPWPVVERRDRRRAPRRLRRLSGEPSSADREAAGAGPRGKVAMTSLTR